MSGKKVFALVDVFLTNQGYYVLAQDHEEALEMGEGGRYNDYLTSSAPEYDRTEVQGEVPTLTLRRAAPARGQPDLVVIIPTHAQDPLAFHGYLVSEDSIGSREAAYPRSEWQPLEP